MVDLGWQILEQTREHADLKRRDSVGDLLESHRKLPHPARSEAPGKREAPDSTEAST